MQLMRSAEHARATASTGHARPGLRLGGPALRARRRLLRQAAHAHPRARSQPRLAAPAAWCAAHAGAPTCPKQPSGKKCACEHHACRAAGRLWRDSMRGCAYQSQSGLEDPSPLATPISVRCMHAARQTTKARAMRAVALAFEAQLVERVPVEPHDRGVDIVVTAGGMLSCSPRAQQLLGAEGAAGGAACN